MRTEEMAELLEGLASFLDRFGTKGNLNDLRAVGDCLRRFPGESVAGFCSFLVKAREGKTLVRKTSGRDEAKVEEHVNRIRHFLERRHELDYAAIDQMLKPLAALKVPEIKAIGQRIECPLNGKTKAAMLTALRNWLSDIRLSAHQSSFNLSAVGTP